jgi:hypothetical protein
MQSSPGCLTQQPGRGEHVNPQRCLPHFVPPFERFFDAAVPHHHCRVVHQHVDVTAPRDCLLPECFHLVEIREISADHLDVRCRNAARRFLGSCAVAAVMRDDRSVCCTEPPCDCGADPLGRAGHQHRSAAEITHCRPVLRA